MASREDHLMILILVAMVTVVDSQSPYGTDIISKVREEYNTLLQNAQSSVRARKEEQKITANGIPDYLTDAFSVIQALSSSNKVIKKLSYRGEVLASILKTIQARYRLSKADTIMVSKVGNFHLSPSGVVVAPDTDHDLVDVNDFLQCPIPLYDCSSASDKYRTFDGSCNNLFKPLAGRSNIPLLRLLPADYGNGVDSLRNSVNGGNLPSTRHVSHDLFHDQSAESFDHTNMLMIFGQFVDHDLDKVPITKMVDGNGKMKDLMCGKDGCEVTQPACAPILAAPNDRVYQGKKKCVKFVRSEGAPDLKCTMGSRQQANQITSYIDASLVYGNTKKETKSLRDNSNPRRGKLRTEHHPYNRKLKDLLPYGDVPACREVTSTVKCFKAGDGRANENIGLTTIHILFLREHNRIEKILHGINPHWTGEQLYQETRRIMGAVMQHIIYNEYVPAIVGPKNVAKHGLKLAVRYYYGYNRYIDAGIFNSFATAAFRFGHSQIPATMKRLDKNYNLIDEMALSKLIRRPTLLYDDTKGGVDSIILGMIDQPVETTDAFFTLEMTGRLFAENPPHGLGLDLPAINTQRGRDHGLPGYNHYRKLCGLHKASHFNDFGSEMSETNIKRLSKLYKHPDDVDLFVGGILEKHVSGATMGHTFACIVSRQFANLRNGDRFWYENDKRNNPNPFTPDQLKEIKKISLAKIICDNLDNIETIQPRVMETVKSKGFRRPSNYFARFGTYRTNRRVICSQVPSIDLNAWKEFGIYNPYAKRRPQQLRLNRYRNNRRRWNKPQRRQNGFNQYTVGQYTRPSHSFVYNWQTQRRSAIIPYVNPHAVWWY